MNTESVSRVSRTFYQNVKPGITRARSLGDQMLPYWIAAAIAALVSILFAQAFKWSEEIALSRLNQDSLWCFLFIPIGILVSTALVEFLSPNASGSGIPQIIAGIELSNTAKKPNKVFESMFDIPMILVKFFGACVCVMTGGAIGREGPNLQISAGIFNQVYKYWPKGRKSPNMQSMILAGGAAGLASAFNTPLGGVVFAIEELAKVHISSIRTAVFQAVIIAGITVQAILGDYLYLGKAVLIVHGGFIEIMGLSAAAALIGFISALTGQMIIKAVTWRSRFSIKSRFLISLAFGLGAALLFFSVGSDGIGSGRVVITDLLLKPDQATWALGPVRLLANFFAYSAGAVGGVFAPALSTGAAFGSWLGAELLGSTSKLWVLVGMVAFLTGLTRTPFTSMILVFEMTDSHEVIIVLMLGAMIAQGAAYLVSPTSFYEQVSHRFIKRVENFDRPPESVVNVGTSQTL